MRDDLSELKAACAKQSARTAVEVIRDGGTTWLAGRPTDAPHGTIALSQNGLFKIVMRDEDIRNVEKLGDVYLVEVGTEANILISLEKIVKASLSDCDCHSEPKPSVMYADVDPSVDKQIINIDDTKARPNRCQIVVECQTIAGRRVCFITGVSCTT